jgi:peptidyl-prolyl cis-trans isomerase D
MLNTFRESLNTPWLKLVLAITALGLIGYLGAYCGIDYSQTGGGPGGAWVAKVNGEALSLREFQQRARIQAGNYRQLFGQEYDQAQLANEVVGYLVRREIMCQEAEKAGLTVSSQETAERIFETFAGPDGQFIGAQQYQDVVRRSWGVAPETFESWISNDVLADKWEEMVTVAVRVSEGDVEQYYRSRTEKTSIDYAIVASADQDDDLQTTDEQLAAWYEEHREDYRRAAGRKIRYVLGEYQARLDTVQVSDEEVAAFYETNKDSYLRPEQRRARHILFRLQPDMTDEDKQALRQKAEGVLERIRAGEDFSGLAVAMSEDKVSGEKGGDLDYFGRGDMVPDFENAAFDTPVGELAPVVETVFGFHVIQVTDARPAGFAPLAEKQEEIRQQLRAGQAQQLVRDQIDRVANAATGADTFQAAAEQEGLTVVELDVREGDRLGSIGASPDFLDAVFQLAPGSVSRPVGAARGMALLVVDEELPAEIAPLEDVRNRVRTDVLNARLKRLASEAARKALEGGGGFEAAVKSLGLEIQESGELAPGSPQLSGTGGSTPELTNALFGDQAAEGDEGVVEVPAGAVLYRITKRLPFDRELFEDSREALETELIGERKRDILNQLLLKLLDGDYDVEYNTEVLSQFTS